MKNTLVRYIALLALLICETTASGLGNAYGVQNGTHFPIRISMSFESSICSSINAEVIPPYGSLSFNKGLCHILEVRAWKDGTNGSGPHGAIWRGSLDGSYLFQVTGSSSQPMAIQLRNK